MANARLVGMTQADLLGVPEGRYIAPAIISQTYDPGGRLIQLAFRVNF